MPILSHLYTYSKVYKLFIRYYGEIMNDIQGYDARKHARTRSRLTKLELNVAALPDIPQKEILFNEIESAKVALAANDATYSEALWGDIRGNIWRIKWCYRIFPNQFGECLLKN